MAAAPAAPLTALKLPLSWEAWFVSSELPLPEAPLHWPAGAQPIAEIRVERFERLPSLSRGVPDLLVAEIRSETELASVVEAMAPRRFAALLLLADEVSEEAAAEAQGAAPELLQLRPSGPPSAVTQSAGRALEDLVRRRVYRILLAHWRLALEDHERQLREADVLSSNAVFRARPTMAPLSTIENVHVAGTLGLWWPGSFKPNAQLGVSHARLRRLRTKLPAGLEKAVEATQTSSRRLKLLLVEDDEALARATRRVLHRVAETRLERELEIALAPTGEAARRHVLDEGPPDLMWVDMQLESPRAGIDFVSWMRTRGWNSVVLGKTSRAPLVDIQELTRLGALSVWSGVRTREVHGLLSDAMNASDEATAIAHIEKTIDQLSEALAPRLKRAHDVSALHQGIEQARSIIEGLELDLSTPLPSGARQPRVSLEEVQQGAIRLALEASGGNATEAARLLDLDPRRLQRLLKKAGS